MMRFEGTYKNHRDGFTLLETLIALVILATGMVSIMLLFPIAMERHRVSAVRTMTTSIAQTQLGALRAADTDADFHQWLRDRQITVPEAPASDYVESWVVSSQPAGEIDLGLYRVTIGLRLWDGRTEYYTTYVTDR